MSFGSLMARDPKKVSFFCGVVEDSRAEQKLFHIIGKKLSCHVMSSMCRVWCGQVIGILFSVWLLRKQKFNLWLNDRSKIKQKFDVEIEKHALSRL